MPSRILTPNILILFSTRIARMFAIHGTNPAASKLSPINRAGVQSASTDCEIDRRRIYSAVNVKGIDR